MANRSPWDDDRGLSVNLRAIGKPNLGTASEPLGTVYATSVVGQEILANNSFLEATDAAGTGVLKLVKGDATDNTVINAKTGKVIKLEVNEVVIGTASATALTYPSYLLSDGSDKNYPVGAAAAGDTVALTNSFAVLDSNANITLDKAGKYLIFAQVNLQFAGATFAASRTVTLKVRRTNNTAADVTGAITVLGTGVVTTVTGTFASVLIPIVTYTTALTSDILTVQGVVSVVPSAGALNATEVSLVATRLSAS